METENFHIIIWVQDSIGPIRNGNPTALKVFHDIDDSIGPIRNGNPSMNRCATKARFNRTDTEWKLRRLKNLMM